MTQWPLKSRHNCWNPWNGWSSQEWPVYGPLGTCSGGSKENVPASRKHTHCYLGCKPASAAWHPFPARPHHVGGAYVVFVAGRARGRTCRVNILRPHSCRWWKSVNQEAQLLAQTHAHLPLLPPARKGRRAGTEPGANRTERSGTFSHH